MCEETQEMGASSLESVPDQLSTQVTMPYWFSKDDKWAYPQNVVMWGRAPAKRLRLKSSTLNQNYWISALERVCVCWGGGGEYPLSWFKHLFNSKDLED